MSKNLIKSCSLPIVKAHFLFKNLVVKKKVVPLHRIWEQVQKYNAEIAQLVEHNLAKVGVASSSLVFRSNIYKAQVAEW